MQTDAEEEIRAASLANVRNGLRCSAARSTQSSLTPLTLTYNLNRQQRKTCTHPTPSQATPRVDCPRSVHPLLPWALSPSALS